MAQICPSCSSTDVSFGFDGGHCLACGAAVRQSEKDAGVLEADKDGTALVNPGPADTSLATPTATPVYAEREKDRQPAVDTNLEPVPSNAPPGPCTKAAPDLEAVNVAGELSDETPEEKKSGGPADVPRTADLTKTGTPSKDTLYDHANDPVPADGEPTDEELAVNLDPSEDDAKPVKVTAKKRSVR